MHVSGLLPAPLDLSWVFQFVFTAFVVALGLLYLVKNTASKYFMVDANFNSSSSSDSSDYLSSSESKMPSIIDNNACAVCRNSTTKHCSRCKMVRYCSEACQISHWKSGHNKSCKDSQLSSKVNSVQSGSALWNIKPSTTVLLNPAGGTYKNFKELKKVLFPYEEFMQFYNWEKSSFPPCGLLNCGNSCFANVVLQCLQYTRPLVAYLLEKGHRRECRRNDWCFMCEFQTHVERATQTTHPFSPINILSRLPNIGGNLGHGKQEDAHEFMRFAIDTMQSVCLDEFGGEKAVHPSAQETTFIQHIFGGHLQSQVMCTKCSTVSNQFENMMDLTVEIQGDAASLEECLDQFTAREWLHGDNMYKCDGCNDYVLAWKRLTIRRAPNVLTIALKRFQSGRFGKLNKRVSFPETLNLSPYMSEAGDDSDVYKLYAVVVHVDMLNASFFGHYICYTKDFSGNWYRIDDCKVCSVDLDEVLLQGAYMLLYSRVSARPSRLNLTKPATECIEEKLEVAQEVASCAKKSVECAVAVSIDNAGTSGPLLSDTNSETMVSCCQEELSSVTEDVKEDLDMVDSEVNSSIKMDVEVHGGGSAGAVTEVDTVITSEAGVLEQLPSVVCNVENVAVADGSSAKGCIMMDSPINSTGPSQNCVWENGKSVPEDSVLILSSGEVLDEAYSNNSSCKPEKVVSGKVFPYSRGIQDAAGKKDGQNSSGSKLKPLFPPGFLGKRPRKKSSKQDIKASAGIGHLTSACNPNDQSDGGSPQPETSHRNGEHMRDGVPHFACYKQTMTSQDEDWMVTSQSSEPVGSPCDGGSGVPVISKPDIVMDNDGPIVIEQTPTFNVSNDDGSLAVEQISTCNGDEMLFSDGELIN